jgi:RNA polymerase-binding transcription factor DksA
MPSKSKSSSSKRKPSPVRSQPKPKPKHPTAKKPKSVSPSKSKPARPPAPVKPPAPTSAAKPMSKSSGKPEKPAAKPAVPPKGEKPEKAAATAAPVKKSSARDLLRSRILGRQKTSKPIAFSLDEVREIAKTAPVKETVAPEAKPAKGHKPVKVDLAAKPSKPNHVGAASLADILGFNPAKPRKPIDDDEAVPEKFRRYYKLLLDLRSHVTGQLDTHTEDTLKRSAKDDAGDLSSYGQHMADAGTDTFDRDFALSLVSSEQEALSEIEAAIRRIKNGTYGVCEMTSKPISKDRLLAVPFTRYSADAQKEIERNRHRSRTQAGLFGEMGEEGAKITEESDDE